MLNYKWIPVSEAIPGKEYHGYKEADKPNAYHLCSITHKSGTTGLVFGKTEVNNIIEYQYRMSFQEQEEYAKSLCNFDDEYTIATLFGLFHDLYDVGLALHEMYNGWIEYDFYTLLNNAKEEDINIIGVAPAPHQWRLPEQAVAIVFESEGKEYWCHAHKDAIDEMRESMLNKYNEIKEKYR